MRQNWVKRNQTSISKLSYKLREKILYVQKLKTVNLKVIKLTQRFEKLNIIRISTLNELITNEKSITLQINSKQITISEIKSQITGIKPNKSLNDINKYNCSFDEEISVNYSPDCKGKITVNKNMSSIDSNLHTKMIIQEDAYKEKIDFQLREVKFFYIFS